MATTPVLISLQQYLDTPYKPDVHFANGELEERNVGKYDHGKIQGWLFFIFQLHAREWKTDPTVEQRIQTDSSNVRIADVAVMRADAPREAVITHPPLICVEVLSADDRLSRVKLVLQDYLLMGVQNIWLIDPAGRAAWTFDVNGLREADPANLTVPGTPIRVDLTEAFAALG